MTSQTLHSHDEYKSAPEGTLIKGGAIRYYKEAWGAWTYVGSDMIRRGYSSLEMSGATRRVIRWGQGRVCA